MSGILPCHHGTITGYTDYRCRCGACRRAWLEYMRDWREKALKGPIPESSAHGTRSTYNSYGCRCEPCKAANSAYMREYKAARAWDAS